MINQKFNLYTKKKERIRDKASKRSLYLNIQRNYEIAKKKGERKFIQGWNIWKHWEFRKRSVPAVETRARSARRELVQRYTDIKTVARKKL